MDNLLLELDQKQSIQKRNINSFLILPPDPFQFLLNGWEYEENMKKHSHLYYDIMYPLWNMYHRYILHKGHMNWLTSCNHMNPYDVLTPRRFKKQIKNILKEENKPYRY